MSQRSALFSEETTDDDGENMYLLQNLMDLLKKAKLRRKAREHSGNFPTCHSKINIMNLISIH